MDMRRHLRFKTDMRVKVTCLDPPNCSVIARLADLSKCGIGIVLDCDLGLLLGDELLPGTVVKVEWDRTVLLGELIYCRPFGKEFLAGLEVEDAIYDTAPLDAIAKRW